MVRFRLLFGRTKTISEDLARFSCKLLTVDHESICSISELQVLALLAGMIKYGALWCVAVI